MSKLVFLKNDQIVTSSVNVANTFEKRHDNILRDIEKLKKDVLNFEEMFFLAHEPDSYGRSRKIYLMNRDGFTLLAMGFTGKRALEFKLEYINKFNEMERELAQQKKPKTQLEILQESINQLVEQEKRIAALEQKQDDITKIISLNSRKDWRKETNEIINKIAQNNGGTYKQTRRESYSRLETRARCDLDRRLENKIERLKEQGAPKRVINNLNYLDVIADDPRLIEIYLTIVKEMAIEHGISIGKEAI